MTAAPCRLCGISTDRGLSPRRKAGVADRGTYVVGVCEDCASLRPDEPGSAVRAVLRLIGRPEGDWSVLVPVFGQRYNVGHVLYEATDREQPSEKPWSHVPEDVLSALRALYVGWLANRVANGAPDGSAPSEGVQRCPDPRGGCLACGVAEAETWHPLTTGALTSGPEMISGVLCGSCGDALETTGAVGPSMLERAFLGYNGLEWFDDTRIPRLRSWVSTGHPPGEPWAWVRLAEPAKTLEERVAALEAALAQMGAGR